MGLGVLGLAPTLVLSWIGDASRERGEPSHPGVVLRKEKLFKGFTAPSGCVCVSNHAAAGQAAAWEWEKATSASRAFETALSLGVDHSFVNGKQVPKLFFSAAFTNYLSAPEHAHPTTSLPWDQQTRFKEMSWPKAAPFFIALEC